MGWSCAALAAFTMDAWRDACVANSGSSNVWTDASGSYFFEASRTEHDDGAITGTIWRNVDATHCRKAGSFRIEGDGTIARAPAFLKRAAVDGKAEIDRKRGAMGYIGSNF